MPTLPHAPVMVWLWATVDLCLTLAAWRSVRGRHALWLAWAISGVLSMAVGRVLAPWCAAALLAQSCALARVVLSAATWEQSPLHRERTAHVARSRRRAS